MQKRRHLDGSFHQPEACSSFLSQSHSSLLPGSSFQGEFTGLKRNKWVIRYSIYHCIFWWSLFNIYYLLWTVHCERCHQYNEVSSGESGYGTVRKSLKVTTSRHALICMIMWSFEYQTLLNEGRRCSDSTQDMSFIRVEQCGWLHL